MAAVGNVSGWMLCLPTRREGVGIIVVALQDDANLWAYDLCVYSVARRATHTSQGACTEGTNARPRLGRPTEETISIVRVGSGCCAAHATRAVRVDSHHPIDVRVCVDKWDAKGDREGRTEKSGRNSELPPTWGRRQILGSHV